MYNFHQFFRFSSANSTEATNNIRLVLLALFGATLPFDMFYSTFILYLIGLSTLVEFSWEKLKSIPNTFLLFFFVIILSLSGLLYSTDTGRAHYLVERQLAFVIFPIIIPMAIGKISQIKVNFIFIVFSISCVYSVIFLLISAIDLLYGTQLPLRYLFTYSFFNHNFSAPIGIHATYLSLYTSVAFVYIASQYKQIKSMFYRLLLIAGLVILIIGLFFLQARNPVFSIFFIFLFIYPYFNVSNKKKYYIGVVTATVLIILFGSQSTYVKKRFTTELSTEITKKHHFTSRNPEPRIWRWACAVDIIKKKPVFGYGTGDEMPLLLDAYQKNNLKVSYREQFNTHNQYLALLIKHGFVGLLLFLVVLIYFFRLAILGKDFMYISFLVIVTFGFLTENIIDANKGIFFFAFFNTLLGYNCLARIKEKNNYPVSTNNP